MARHRRLHVLRRHLCASASPVAPTHITCNILDFGVEIHGLNVDTVSRETLWSEVLPLVRKHGLAIIRGAGTFPGALQEDLARMMSPSARVYTGHRQHAAAPSTGVFCISSDPKSGNVGVGGAWHHDSLHLEQIPPFACYRLACVPERGEDAERAATWFASADASMLSGETLDLLRHLRGFYLPTAQQHALLRETADGQVTWLPPTLYGLTLVDDDGEFVRRLSPAQRERVVVLFHRFVLLGECPGLGELRRAVEYEGAPEDESAVKRGALSKGIQKQIRRWEVRAIAIARAGTGGTAANSKGKTQARAVRVRRHCWQPGDLVITANDRVMHRAPTREALSALSSKRTLHRSIALA